MLIEENQRVEFGVGQGQKGPQATDLLGTSRPFVVDVFAFAVRGAHPFELVWVGLLLLPRCLRSLRPGHTAFTS